MRAAKLMFGDRVHCPFLRPIFLDPRDVARVAQVAETIADVGERVRAGRAARIRRSLDAVGLTDAEKPLVAIDPGYAAREHRVAARLLPLARRPPVRRIQRRVAGGLRLHERLARVFERCRSWRASESDSAPSTSG